MRQVAKRGILTAVATGSVLASTAGYAYANADAQGGAVNSPGVGSGNAVQAPVDIPVNACGNTVDAVGALNPAFGNSCANAVRSMPSVPGQGHPGHHHAGHLPPPHSAPMQTGHTGGNAGGWQPGAGHLHPGGASAAGVAHGSPGVVAGNQVQAPVTVPVNACGNSVNLPGLLNPAFGNSCGNETHSHPPVHSTPPPPRPTEDCPPEAHNPPPPPPADDCTPGTHNPPPPGGHNPPPPGDTPPVSQPPAQTPPVEQPPAQTPPAQTPPAQTPPVQAPSAGTPTADTPPAGAPGSDRNGGPVQATPVSSSTTGNGTPSGGTGETHTPRQGARALDTTRAQLASTGTNALGLELAGTAGLAMMIGGGVLYRRSRAGAR
ncbi:chaplin family protein [Kitasatospora sp. NPDC002227]|uniref:chaplin n=1 Tax=Kitasatospora sp. NPDC002227 TaxID=3154773 RepID=UPI003327317A